MPECKSLPRKEPSFKAGCNLHMESKSTGLSRVTREPKGAWERVRPEGPRYKEAEPARHRRQLDFTEEGQTLRGF